MKNIDTYTCTVMLCIRIAAMNNYVERPLKLHEHSLTTGGSGRGAPIFVSFSHINWTYVFECVPPFRAVFPFFETQALPLSLTKNIDLIN